MTSTMVFGAMLGAGVLLASALSPQSANAADDTKRYAGDGCDSLFSTDLIDRTSFGAINNPSTSVTVVVVCPVIRDNTGTSSLGVKRGFVTVFDHNAGANQDVSCDIIANDASGLGVRGVSVSSLGSSSKVQKLQFGAVPAPAGGFLHLVCQLPPNTSAGKSGVVGYEITEN